MGFHNGAYLPELESPGSAYGAGFRTRIVETDSNHFRRYAQHNQALFQYDLSFSVRTQEILNRIHGFYLMRGGGENTFPFKDPFDFTTAFDGQSDWDDADLNISPLNELQGVVDGVNRRFQCVKRYFDPALPDYGYIRIVTKLVNGEYEFNIDGVPQAGVAVDHLSGEIVFATGPTLGQIPSWRGQFDVEVGFAPGSDESFRKLLGRGVQGGMETPLLLIEEPSRIAIRDDIPYGGSKPWGTITGNITIALGEGALQVWSDESTSGADVYLPDAQLIPDGIKHLTLVNEGSKTSNVKLSDLTTSLVSLGPGTRKADLHILKRSGGIKEYIAATAA